MTTVLDARAASDAAYHLGVARRATIAYESTRSLVWLRRLAAETRALNVLAAKYPAEAGGAFEEARRNLDTYDDGAVDLSAEASSV